MKRLMALFLGVVILMSGCARKVIEKERIINVEKKLKVSNRIWKIPIALKDSEYKNIKTILITTDADFKKFLSKIESKKKWKRRDNFLTIIKEAKVNFKDENFLLYSFKEDSAFVISTVNPPIDLDDENVSVIIEKELAKEHLSGKFNYYALAYKVKKGVKNIIFIDGKERKVIKNSN